MEKRKDAEHSLILIEMEDLARSLHIGIDIEMGEHYAFGFPGASAAENDGGHIVHGQRDGLATGPFDEPGGSTESQKRGGKLLPRADSTGNILQPQDRRTVR